jgi:hypothetical protein
MVVDAVPLSENLKEMIFTSGTSYSTFFEGNEKIRIEEQKKIKSFPLYGKQQGVREEKRGLYVHTWYTLHLFSCDFGISF